MIFELQTQCAAHCATCASSRDNTRLLDIACSKNLLGIVSLEILKNSAFGNRLGVKLKFVVNFLKYERIRLSEIVCSTTYCVVCIPCSHTGIETFGAVSPFPLSYAIFMILIV
ncbi:hypothetical protein PHYBLDRAFT_66895 [Phycomyces blakesleeanus NRRL 1555(-)]|uniref:Uncharacterized protein n=1 Tax=Phycomyces blakesleeanus (strain ATCC 8743b / DSM 1359 / FGSC 10004 / NBRC 33097 / NRRL 1555) TaxID=763407 RepID=A0A167KXW9_PHYB8|nr:hypothetical protein PHYBLDRAFT_66895 [Phycomyces blakesleeanus NRRL 1555(-)]OAD69136.1 hypothetical protein PHYBLDRAFT_66895 [Phycomyces blakesleeanus NRRL 1555(-)]|eukprot:XP_018287176.1 hypothetical protein PHYBLDRAFT_66895 [Phycomyces blakesleeanus NRRL 1555(-)]